MVQRLVGGCLPQTISLPQQTEESMEAAHGDVPSAGKQFLPNPMKKLLELSGLQLLFALYARGKRIQV